MDSQSGQHLRKDLPEHPNPAAACPAGLRQHGGQRLGFGPVLVARDLPGRRIQVGHHLDHGGRVLAMEIDQLRQDEAAVLATRMAVDLTAGHHLVGELAMFALAYNLVRSVMFESARGRKVAAERTGFLDALRWLTNPIPGGDPSGILINPHRPTGSSRG